MALLTESWLRDTSLLLLLLVLLLLYVYFNQVYGYFRLKGIPYLRPIPLLGHTCLFNRSQSDVYHVLYNSFPDEKFFGFFQFTEPTLMVRDPKLLHRILVKDFAHFHDRGFATVDGDVLQTLTLFGLKGSTWRTLRSKLSPTFSTGKLKHMFGQFTTSGDHLLQKIEEDSSDSKEALDAKTLAMSFATEVVASTAFGIDFSKENPQSEELVSKLAGAFKKSNFWFTLVFFLVTTAPRLLRWAGVNAAKRETTEYFVNLTKATKRYRLENNVQRHDYFHLLLELQNGEEKATQDADNDDDNVINQLEYAPEDGKARPTATLLTDEDLTAQAFVFLFAGTEPVSMTVSFALYHIAKNKTLIQEKLIDEIDSALAKHGGFTYQSVKEMTYLDQVLQETLRLHPPLPYTLRECTIPYLIPGTDIVLEKGAKVSIPLGSLQMDPKYYPEPNIFRPERFTGNHHKPCPTYMPFGDGPRICIAMRFALVEIKVCLAKILSQYQVELNNRTQEPLVLEKGSFAPKVQGGIWINLKRRD